MSALKKAESIIGELGAAASLNERNPHPFFQRNHMLAKCRLRHIECLCRRTEVQMSREYDVLLEPFRVHVVLPFEIIPTKA